MSSFVNVIVNGASTPNSNLGCTLMSTCADPPGVTATGSSADSETYPGQKALTVGTVDNVNSVCGGSW